MKFKRVTKWILLTVAGLLAAAFVFVSFVLFTGPGGNIAVRFANRAQDQIHVGGFRGRLIRHFELNDITVSMGAVTADVDEVEVVWRAAPLLGRRVHVERIRVNGARVVLGVAPVDSTGDASEPADSAQVFALPIDITADDIDLRGISVDMPDSVRLRDATLSASFKDERYEASVSAFFLAPAVDSARVDLHASGGLRDVDVDTLRVAVWRGVVAVSGRATWSPSITFAGSVDIDSVRTPILKRPVNAHAVLSADADAKTVRVDTLYATVGSATLHGSASADSVVSVSFDLDAPNLDAVAPSGASLAGDVGLSVTASGRPREFRVSVSLEGDGVVGAGTNFGDGNAVFDATITADSVGIPSRAEIHALNLHTRGIGVDASGSVRWLPDVAWDVALKADSVSFSRPLPDSTVWRGRVSLEATSDGFLRDDGPHANVDVTSLAGVVNGQPLNGKARGSVNGRKVDAEVVDISWGPVTIVGNGRVDETIDVSFDIDATDLAAVVPNAAGALALTLKASGDIGSPDLKAEITASDLAYGDAGVRSFAATIDANLGQETGAVIANVHAAGIAAAGQAIDTLTVHAAGSRAAHELTVFASTADIALDLALNGGVDDDAWRGRIDAMRIAVTGVDEWKTEAPAPVSVGREHAELDTLCLKSATSEICVTGMWSKGDSVRAGIMLDRFDLVALAPVLPDSLGVAGTVSGMAEMSLRDTVVTARADFELAAAQVTYKMNGATQRADLGGKLSARADTTGVSASLGLDVDGSGGKATVAGALTMDGYQLLAPARSNQPIEASLDLDVPDLSFIGAFTGALKDVRGQLIAHMAASGSLQDMALTSRIDLTGGRVRVPAANITIDDITLQAEGDKGGRASINGHARSGEGEVEVSGGFTSARGEWLSADVKVNGDQFTVLNTPEMRVLISPHIEARVDSSAVKVSGDLVIPVARIRLAEVPTSAVAPSKDVVYVGDETGRGGPLDVNTDVRIVLGDSVSFHGFGFKGGLEGTVLAVQRPQRKTTGTGQLQIRRGTYRAYNTALTIDPGRVIFGGGPIDNPALDVRAYRKTNDDVIAGVIIRGTVNKPTLDVYSEPTMAQSDALSYLILGRKVSENDSGDGQMLGTAALSMGLAQSSVITEGIGGQIGLDQAGVESEGPLEEASFVAGKYLSPELYMSYGVGLFDKQTTVRIRYMLSSRWTLQAESGRETSTDLLFRIERGE